MRLSGGRRNRCDPCGVVADSLEGGIGSGHPRIGVPKTRTQLVVTASAFAFVAVVVLIALLLSIRTADEALRRRAENRRAREIREKMLPYGHPGE